MSAIGHAIVTATRSSFGSGAGITRSGIQKAIPPPKKLSKNHFHEPTVHLNRGLNNSILVHYAGGPLGPVGWSQLKCLRARRERKVSPLYPHASKQEQCKLDS